ncbi:MAG: Fic family protein [Bacteroidales bacterium]|nr:Fic family protein [Bacteroidales bacterium]
MSRYNIPTLPPPFEIETKAVLKQTAASHRRLAELKGAIKSMPNLSILINTLALQESKDSSEIESIITTHDELYRAQISSAVRYVSAAAKEVENYNQALYLGFDEVSGTNLLTCNTIIKIYQAIKNNTAGFRQTPGTTLQNEQTKEVVYEPPQSYEEIVAYMNNLEKFINDDSLCDFDPLVKLAIIHHQFESIHPFSDGNGRTGRIINILYLVRQGLLDLPVLYLSRYITHNKGRYYHLLQDVRDNNNWEDWTLFILKGIEETSVATTSLVEQIKALMMNFKHRIREEFPKIYSQDLINNLFRHPYTKIDFVQQELKVSKPTAISYLKQLCECKSPFLQKLELGRENYYVNNELFNLLQNAFRPNGDE